MKNSILVLCTLLIFSCSPSKVQELSEQEPNDSVEQVHYSLRIGTMQENKNVVELSFDSMKEQWEAYLARVSDITTNLSIFQIEQNNEGFYQLTGISDDQKTKTAIRLYLEGGVFYEAVDKISVTCTSSDSGCYPKIIPGGGSCIESKNESACTKTSSIAEDNRVFR